MFKFNIFVKSKPTIVSGYSAVTPEFGLTSPPREIDKPLLCYCSQHQGSSRVVSSCHIPTPSQPEFTIPVWDYVITEKGIPKERTQIMSPDTNKQCISQKMGAYSVLTVYHSITGAKIENNISFSQKIFALIILPVRPARAFIEIPRILTRPYALARGGQEKTVRPCLKITRTVQ